MTQIERDFGQQPLKAFTSNGRRAGNAPRAPGAPEGAVGSRGKFIVIWKRDAEGRWRMHADGFSPVD